MTTDQEPAATQPDPALDATMPWRSATRAAVPGTTGTTATGPDGQATVVAHADGIDPVPTPTTQERWATFAATQEAPPGWIRRLARRVGRLLSHEYSLATAAALLLAVVLTWPTLQYPGYTLPQSLTEPAWRAWQVAWTGHALITDPLHIFHANTFHPDHGSLAYADALLGYAPAGMLGTGQPAALLRYNLLFVLAQALCLIGAYALVRQLGARRTGAAVAAVVFAFAPWRLGQVEHLQVISSGGIPLALAMLARGHGWSLRYGYRPRLRHLGWTTAGWLVATWQLTLGLGLGVPFAYLLGMTVVVVALAYGVHVLRRRKAAKPFGWRLLLADGVGATLFVVTGVLLTLQYLHVPAPASASPSWHELLIAPAQSLLWGGAHARARGSSAAASQLSLLPGYALYALALLGLIWSVWRVHHRLLLLAGAGVMTVLALGGTVAGGRVTRDVPLWEHALPGGGLMLWPTLLLAILAAGAVAEFVRRAAEFAATRIPSWPGPWLRLATLLPLVLVMAEGMNRVPQLTVPLQPTAMRTVDGPALVLPTSGRADALVALWSTSTFPQVANGSAGWTPPRLAELRQASVTFPDAASIGYLRSKGVRSVLLLRDFVAGTPWEHTGDIPVDDLGIEREDRPGAVLFRL